MAAATITGEAPNQTLNLTLPRAEMPDMSEYATKEDLYNSTTNLKETILGEIDDNSTQKIVDVVENDYEAYGYDSDYTVADQDIVKSLGKDDDNLIKYWQYYDKNSDTLRRTAQFFRSMTQTLGMQVPINGNATRGAKVTNIIGISRTSDYGGSPTNPITISNVDLSNFELYTASSNPLVPDRVSSTYADYPNFFICDLFNNKDGFENRRIFEIVRADEQNFNSNAKIKLVDSNNNVYTMSSTYVTVDGNKILISGYSDFPEEAKNYKYFRIDFGEAVTSESVGNMELFINYPINAYNKNTYEWSTPDAEKHSIPLNYTLEGGKDIYDEVRQDIQDYGGYWDIYWRLYRRMEREVVNSTNFIFVDVVPKNGRNFLKVTFNRGYTEYKNKIPESNAYNFFCTHFSVTPVLDEEVTNDNVLYIPNGQISEMYFVLPVGITTLEEATTYMNNLGATLVHPLEYADVENITGETYDKLKNMDIPSEFDDDKVRYGFVWQTNTDARLLIKSEPFFVIKTKEGPYATQEEIGDIQTLLDNLDIGEGV